MIRLSLAALLSIAGVMTIVVPSEAQKATTTWQEHRKKSADFAKNEQWRQACRQAVWAGAGMAKENFLTVDYMAKIGKRCSEAGRTNN